MCILSVVKSFGGSLVGTFGSLMFLGFTVGGTSCSPMAS